MCRVALSCRDTDRRQYRLLFIILKRARALFSRKILSVSPSSISEALRFFPPILEAWLNISAELRRAE